jgi:cobaltochelatase CobS
VFEPDHWPEQQRPFIPKGDPRYVLHLQATADLCSAIALRRPSLSTGPKGSGKTSLPKEICARLGIPIVRISCNQSMEVAAFFGGINPETMQYSDGTVTEFAQYGGYVIIDEVSKLPAGITVGLMEILERGGKIFLPEKPGTTEDRTVTPVADFWIGATDNTVLQGDTSGSYVSCMVQDEALIDRFAITVYLPYLSEDHEIKLVQEAFPAMQRNNVLNMVRCANQIRAAYDEGAITSTFSPRGLLDWAEQYLFWQSTPFPMQHAFRACFFNKMTEQDQALVAQFYESVFAEQITR